MTEKVRGNYRLARGVLKDAMEKPPILKKKQISGAIEESDEDNDEFWMPEDALVRVAQAQLDADVEWYEERVAKELLALDVDALLNPEHPIYRRLAEIVVSMADKIRQEIAREIFEEMERNPLRYFKPRWEVGDYTGDLGIVGEGWQSLKERYLNLA